MRYDGSLTREKNDASEKDDGARLRELYAASRRGGWTRQAVGAGLGLVGGGVAPVVGALLLAVAWARGGVQTNGLSLHGAGSVLLLSTIPLLLLGGHCLDLLEERTGKRARHTAAAKISSRPLQAPN
jgi:hypothetical protein